MIDSKYQIINKNIGKLFSRYELLFLVLGNSNSDPSQILIQQFPIPRASLTISVEFYPSQLKPFFNLILIMLLIGLPILYYPNSTTRHHKYCIFQSICQDKPMKLIIKLYSDHNTLQVKQASHQKAESLKGSSLSKLDNTVDNNSIFNTKYAEFSTKW